MNATALRLLHLRRLRHQPLRTALAVVGIGAGVALALAVTVASTSVSRSLSDFASGLSGPARFKVVGPTTHGGLPEEVIAEVEAVAGVDEVVPFVTGVTEASDRRGDTLLVAFIGADCRALVLVGDEACGVTGAPADAADGEPILSSALAERLDGGAIHTNVGDRPVTAPLALDELDVFNEGMVAIYPLRTAQVLFTRPASIDAAYVVPSPGADLSRLRGELEAAVGPSAVIRDADTGPSPTALTGPFLPFLFLISLFGLTVGSQLVHNTVVLSLAERRRELAMTAAIGGPPRSIAVGVVAENAVTGLAGGLVGIAMGVLVARPFVDNLSQQAEEIAGIHLSVHVTPVAVAIGLALGVGASVVASIGPAWRLRNMEVAGELADRVIGAQPAPTIPRLRTASMLAVLALGVAAGWLGQRNNALEPWQPPLVLVGLVLAGTVAFRLPSPLAPALFSAFRRVPLLSRGPARVAIGGLNAQPRRVAAATLAVGAAVGLAVGIGTADLASGARGLAADTTAGRVFVSTLGPNNTSAIDAKVPPPVVRRLTAVPGVADVDRSFHTMVEHPRVGVLALNSHDGAGPSFEVIEGSSGEEAAARDEVMVGPAVARDLGLDPGDTFAMPGRSGLVELTVGGIWKDADNLGRSLTVGHPTFRALAGDKPPNSLTLVPEPGLSARALADRVRAAELHPRLNVWEPDQLATVLAEEWGTFVQPFRILQRGLLGVAFVATTSTLLLAALQRRREHGLLMALGLAPAGLAKVVLIEAGLIGLAGTAFGWVSGVVGGQLFVFASPVVTGLEVPLDLSIVPVITTGLVAAAFVLAGAALPAWRTSRLDPVVALRYE